MKRERVSTKMGLPSLMAYYKDIQLDEVDNNLDDTHASKMEDTVKTIFSEYNDSRKEESTYEESDNNDKTIAANSNKSYSEQKSDQKESTCTTIEVYRSKNSNNDLHDFENKKYKSLRDAAREGDISAVKDLPIKTDVNTLCLETIKGNLSSDTDSELDNNYTPSSNDLDSDSDHRAKIQTRACTHSLTLEDQEKNINEILKQYRRDKFNISVKVAHDGSNNTLDNYKITNIVINRHSKHNNNHTVPLHFFLFL